MFNVKITNKNHPITQGISNFIVTDEQHYLKYNRDEKFVLIQSVNEDGLTHSNEGHNLGTSCQAGWAYERGKGRICYFAPGHMISALLNPEYEKLQKNATRWLLKEILININ